MPQSLSNILVHVIFSTKGRFPFITDAIEPRLFSCISSIGRDLKCPILKINGVSDHVHILCNLSRTETMAHVVEYLKKQSSKWIKTQGEAFTGFQWQVGYGAFSIGYSNVVPLIRYIENQKEHHKQVTFQEEYSQFLSAYHIDYASCYMWD